MDEAKSSGTQLANGRKGPSLLVTRGGLSAFLLAWEGVGCARKVDNPYKVRVDKAGSWFDAVRLTRLLTWRAAIGPPVSVPPRGRAPARTSLRTATHVGKHAPAPTARLLKDRAKTRL